MAMTGNVWQENLAAFKARYAQCQVDDIAPGANSRLEILTSRSGLPTVRVKSPQGKWIFLHSSVDPVREAGKIAAAVSVEPGAILVVYGFGLGYLVEALLAAVDERVPLFIIEPDRELFYAALHTRDMRHIINSDRVYILLSNSASEIKDKFFALYDMVKYSKTAFTGLAGHQTVYSDFYTTAISSIKDAIAARVINRNTMAKIGSAMMSNAIRNLPAYYTHPGVRTLFDRFSGLPAIIVSAGPSLNKNIHLLKEAKGKAVILAVGTALRALQKQRIVPDFVLSIDPGLPNYKHFEGLDTSETVLITEMQSHHRIVEEFKGPLFFSGSMPILRWFDGVIEEKGAIASGGSVANNAMVVAYKMGANPIILVGQDLAYARDGHSHAAGTNYEADVYTQGEDQNHFYVKANDGGRILTDYALYQFLTFFEAWINSHPEREYINATEGGAYIAGTKLMTLREVIDKYCCKTVDVQGAVQQAQQTFTIPDIDPLLEVLGLRLHDINRIMKEAQMAVKNLTRLEQACETRQFKQMRRRLKDVKKVYEMFEQDQYIRDVVEWFSHQDIQGVFRRTYQAEYTEQDDYRAAIADYKLYYNKVWDGARQAKELIEDCFHQLGGYLHGDEQSV